MNNGNSANMASTLHTNCKEAIELLAKIKASGGKRPLNKVGEWMTSDGPSFATWNEKDLKYILR